LVEFALPVTDAVSSVTAATNSPNVVSIRFVPCLPALIIVSPSFDGFIRRLFSRRYAEDMSNEYAIRNVWSDSPAKKRGWFYFDRRAIG
jgi:hypothetical protein